MSKSLPSNKIMNKIVSIRVSGSGTNVWAYALSDETYTRIAQDNEDENPVDIIMSEYLAGQLVCWGIDVDDASTVTLHSAGKSKELKIIKTHEDYSISEALKDRKIRSSEPFIEFNSDTKEQLGENFDLSNFNHVYIESIEWRDIKLELTLPVNSREFDRCKISLLACDMDSGTELSQLTYEQGLLAGVEEDIIGIAYEGKKYFFNSECNRSFTEDRYILSRTDDGWEINEAVDFW